MELQKYIKRGQCPICLDPCKLGAKQCMKCRSSELRRKCTEARNARELARELLRQRPCKHCGKPLNTLNKKQVKCGLNCPAFVKAKVSCIICGVDVERYPSHIERWKATCCSIDCQRIHALKDRGKRVDCESKSRKAKERFRSKSRRKRARKSDMYQFWLLCKARKSTKVSRWKSRCASAAKMLTVRFVGQSKSRKRIESWIACVKNERVRFRGEQLRLSKGEWQWKIDSVASGLRRRKRVKLLQKGNRSISEHIARLDQQPKQLSFWA